MSNLTPESIIELMQKAGGLLAKGVTLNVVCSQLGVSENDLETWNQRYAMPTEAMAQLNDTSIRDCIVPIFKSMDPDRGIDQVGSGVIVAIGSERYLLTAAHVTDRGKDEELYIPTNTGIVPISGTLFYRPLEPNESREGDMIDVSYFRLSNELAVDLHESILPLEVDDIDMSGNCEIGDCFTFCGFPWRKTKRVGLTQETDMATYTGQAVSDAMYANCGCDRSTHIAIRFRLKKSYSWRYQSHKVAGTPEGLSGGGVLSWPLLLEDRLNSPKLKLAGIFHTYKKQSDIFVATKIAPFIYAILEDSPHLAKYFEAASRDISGFGEFISDKMKTLNKTQAPTSIGIGWYLPDTYQKCLSIFDDADDLPDTYQDWLIRALVTEKQFINQGLNVVRVEIDPDVFKKWCKTNRLKKRDKHARSQYCSIMQWEAHKRSLSNQDT